MLRVCEQSSILLENQRLDGCYQHAAEPDHNRIRGAIMADKRLPSVELLRQLLRYEPDTGKLFWLARDAHHFVDGTYSAGRKARAWNARYANTEAFTDIGSHRYPNGSIDGVLYLAHRVIWAMKTGEWPEFEVDHIDGDRTNNRWVNLRSVTHAVNLRNAAGKSCNTSGATGVCWRASRGKWRARIMIDGVERSLGHFDRFEDAAAAREAAQRAFDFTARHGELSHGA